MTSNLAMDRERGPFSGLLVAQLFFIGSTPFIEASGLGRILLLIGVFGVMAAGAYVSSSKRGLLIVSITFLVAAAAIWLGPDLLPGHDQEALSFSVVGFGYAYTTAIVLMTVGQHERVTTDTILGGVNAYLLIAAAFTMFHATLMVVDRESYRVAGEPIGQWIGTEQSAHGLATLFYFSFTTLTTLGYGDIVPATPLARLLTSAEAVLGQLYVAIFIARLVSLETTQRTASR